MPKYVEVDWLQGECSGVYTDLFYMVEEERNTANYIYINAVRSMCARCPIFQECLTYAFNNEQYGVWGGLTSAERKSFSHPHLYPLQKERALKALEELGITRDMIKESYEYSLNERGMENQPTSNREDGIAGNC